MAADSENKGKPSILSRIDGGANGVLKAVLLEPLNQEVFGGQNGFREVGRPELFAPLPLETPDPGDDTTLGGPKGRRR